jgi:peptide/nickel transport system permease protein
MAVIGFTSWTGISSFIRAELLKVRNLEFIEAAEALGYSKWRILFKHAIPNALSPVLIAIAFGIASAILVESFLSFIGLGIPPEVLTWGKLLALSRGGKSQLWVAIFPGLAIFLTVTVFNLIGEGLTDALDPRQKK